MRNTTILKFIIAKFKSTKNKVNIHKAVREGDKKLRIRWTGMVSNDNRAMPSNY